MFKYIISLLLILITLTGCTLWKNIEKTTNTKISKSFFIFSV